MLEAIAAGLDEEKGTGETIWEKQLVEANEMESKASFAESKLAELKEQVRLRVLA